MLLIYKFHDRIYNSPVFRPYLESHESNALYSILLLRFILILSSHPWQAFSAVHATPVFQPIFRINIFYTTRATWPAHLIILHVIHPNNIDWTVPIMKLRTVGLPNFLSPPPSPGPYPQSPSVRYFPSMWQTNPVLPNTRYFNALFTTHYNLSSCFKPP